MKPDDSGWQNLVRSARAFRDERDTSAPYGFATRVAALAMAKPFASVSLLERFSWRALGLAALLAVASLASAYPVLSSPSDEDVLSNDTAVAALFDVS